MPLRRLLCLLRRAVQIFGGLLSRLTGLLHLCLIKLIGSFTAGLRGFTGGFRCFLILPRSD